MEKFEDKNVHITNDAYIESTEHFQERTEVLTAPIKTFSDMIGKGKKTPICVLNVTSFYYPQVPLTEKDRVETAVVIYHESRTPIPRQPFVAWTPRIGKWSRVWRPGMHARVTEKLRSTPGHMSRGPHELASGRVDWRLDIPRVCPRRRRVTLR